MRKDLVRRWRIYTGHAAVLDQNDRSFDERLGTDAVQVDILSARFEENHFNVETALARAAPKEDRTRLRCWRSSCSRIMPS